MRISDEPNVKVLREKARILENENIRLVAKTSELLRENLAFKGMGREQVEQNLPGLLAQLSGSTTTTAQGGSERRSGDDKDKDKKPQRGHGPTQQRELEVVAETYDLDEADKQCPQCGGDLEEWAGHEDVTEVAAVFYTIFESARVNGADGEAYLRYATAELLAERVPRLPYEWAEAKTLQS